MDKVLFVKNKWKVIRTASVFIFIVVLLLVGVICNINTGTVHLSMKEVGDILFQPDKAEVLLYNIIWKIRLPRLLCAALFGGALSIAGFLLQTFFKNPIAGPYVLGISSGARLFVGFVTLASASATAAISSPFALFGAAFFGSMLSMLLVLVISKKVENISVLLIIGMMIGFICSAATDILITFGESNNVYHFTMWSMGSFSGATWPVIKVATIIIVPAVIMVFALSKPLNAYLLGENYAKSMGINTKVFRFFLILLSSILTACVTAFAGPISFVGTAVPYIAKLLFQTASPKVLIPGIFLLGSVFCLYSDLIARTLFSPTELALSTVTSFVGAPIVIWLMLKRKTRMS